MIRSKFTVNVVTDNAVFITDDCETHGPCMSVTNDAENVTQHLYEKFGDKQIFYKDTMGQWDELVHKCGKFLKFAPGERIRSIKNNPI